MMLNSSTTSTNKKLIVVVVVVVAITTVLLLIGIGGVVTAFTTSTSTTITRTTRNINIINNNRISSFQEIQSHPKRRRRRRRCHSHHNHNHNAHRLYHRSIIHEEEEEEDIDKEEECDDTNSDDAIEIDDSSPSSSSSPSPASLFWPSSQQKTTYNKHAAATAAATAVADEVVVDQNQHPIDHYDQIFDSIVKIYSTHNKHPDMMMPWQKLGSYTSTSSGFIIENKKIITNAHSIEYAGQVLVRKRGSNSKKYHATIEVIANECDLAMLTIKDESFWYNDEFDDDEELDDDDGVDEVDGDEYDEDDNNNNGIESTTHRNNDEEDDEYANDDDEESNAVKMNTMMIKPLEFGLLPELQDEVEVIGYPTGGDSLSITKGVVSRIESTEYVQCSGSHLLAIQIDAAINGGNSGGPVICSITQKVIGVAFQSLNDAENIGYVIPVTVVLHFLENIQRNNNNKNSNNNHSNYYYSGVTCLGVRFGKLENSAMRSYLKLPKEKQEQEQDNMRRRRKKKKKGSLLSSSSSSYYSGLGILIRSCDPITPSKQYLKPNDVILYVDDIPVSSDGNIPFRRNGRERVSFSSYIQTKFVTTSLTTRDSDRESTDSSDTVKLDIWRDGKLFEENPIQVPVCISKNLVPSHWNNYSPPYLLVGGLVFTVLSVPYLEEMNAWGDYISDNISYLLTKVNEPLQQENDQIVILVNILPHPTTLGYDSNINNLHLTSLNNQKVRSLQHLQELIRTTTTTTPIATTIAGTDTEPVVDDSDKKEEFLKFEFGGGGSDDNDLDECSGDGDGSGSGGTLIVLETNSLDGITREVCEEHSIQKSYYFPPTVQLQSQQLSTTTSSSVVASSEITTTTTIAPSSAATAAFDDDDDDDNNNDADDVTVASTATTTTATTTTTTATATATATAAAVDNNNNNSNNYSWEDELLKKSKPLIPAPPSISECLHVLKQDGVVRLNPSKFFVNKDLCTKLRHQILNEMNNKPPPPVSAAAATVNNGSTNDNKMNKKKKKERYVPGTRLRFDSSMDLTFGGDVRHDMLLPIDFKDDYDTNFPELQMVLESAASELEPLLLEAVKDMLPRLHGSSSISSIRGNAINGNVVDNDESILENGTSSAEVVEVGSLIVRNGSGHQSVHGDYRRFRDGDGDENNKMKEESIQNTNLRIGKMPPRIVVFVALQDIPSNEYGSTGFITGTHNSQAHGLIYGRDGIDNNEDNSIDDDLRKKARRDLILDNVSTNGVRTTAGFKCGEMLIYDASVLHWGLKNSVVDNDRCMLYFGVARSGSPALLDQDQPLPPDQFEVIPPVLLQDITGANTKSSKKS